MPKAIVFLVLFLPALLDAQTAAPDAAIPPALRDWRAWSMKDLGYRACPFLASSSAKSPGDFVCAWPGRLTLASGVDDVVIVDGRDRAALEAAAASDSPAAATRLVRSLARMVTA